jgi:hypothetical protein
MEDQPTSSQPFPLNRVIAFLGPYVAIVSGAAASWLSQHFPGLHLDTTGTAATISSAIVFVIGAGITWALQHKWLDGWQKWEAALVAIDPVPARAPAGPTLAATHVLAVTPNPEGKSNQPAPSAPSASPTTSVSPPAGTTLAAAASVPAAASSSPAPLAGTVLDGPAPAGIEEGLNPYPGFALCEGIGGPEVRAWQQRMSTLGWTVDVDGSYGPQSSGICRSFQEQHHLPADGVVGPETWRATFAGAP